VLPCVVQRRLRLTSSEAHVEDEAVAGLKRVLV